MEDQNVGGRPPIYEPTEENYTKVKELCNSFFVYIKGESKECYDQMIVLPIPHHMSSYKTARIKAGLSPTICIDPCITEEIKLLWQKGITTYGSCCGHNYLEPFVNVSDDDIPRMLKIGYIQNHPDVNRKDTFRLKSV